MKQTAYNSRDINVKTNVVDGWLIVKMKNMWMREKINLPDGEYLMVKNKLIRIQEVSIKNDPFELNEVPDYIGELSKSDILQLKEASRFAVDETNGLRPILTFITARNNMFYSSDATIMYKANSYFSGKAFLKYNIAFPVETAMVFETKKSMIVRFEDVHFMYTKPDVSYIDYEGIKILSEEKTLKSYYLERDSVFEAYKLANYIASDKLSIKKSKLEVCDLPDYEIRLEKAPIQGKCNGLITLMYEGNDQHGYRFRPFKLLRIFGNHKKLVLNLGQNNEPATFTYVD